MERNNPSQILAVPLELVGERLDKALSLISEIGSRNRAAQLVDQGKVLVNGKTEKVSYKLKAQDQIQISLPEPEPTNLVPLSMKLDILFEDKDLLVVNKPSGLVVHPAAGHAQDTLVNALIHHTDDFDMKFGDDRPGIVHRLDKDTSGVLVVAKNDFTQTALQEQFKARTVHRIYYAVCAGIPLRPEGRIESYLARHPVDRKRYASVRNGDGSIGKYAATNYWLLKKNPAGISLMKLKLETGRTHQIRVHLSEMGLPILGDPIYGGKKKISNAVKDIPRLALHAAELGFSHPRTGAQLSFKVPWPDDFTFLIRQWGFDEGLS